MNLNQTHIVIGKPDDGEAKALYIGEDNAAADAAFESAGKEFAIVGIVNFPQFTRTRFPAAELASAAPVEAAPVEQNSDSKKSSKSKKK